MRYKKKMVKTNDILKVINAHLLFEDKFNIFYNLPPMAS